MRLRGFTLVLAVLLLGGWRSGAAPAEGRVFATKTWTGTTDSDWTKGANWGGSAPAAGDIANIPGGLTNYPIITQSVTIATLNINSAGSGASVTVSSGGTLNVSAAVTVNANGTLTVNGGTILSAGTLTVNGTADISSGTIHMANAIGTNPTDNIIIGATATFTQSGGSVDTKDFTTTSGTPNGSYSQSNGTLKIFHDFKGTGTFNATGGTVEFIGVGGGGTFPATLGPTQFFNVLCTVDPGITAAASFSVAGNWTANAAVDLTGSGAMITFNGSGTQTIGGSGATIFSGLTLNNPGGTLALGATETFGDFIMTTGTLDLNGYSLSVSGSWTKNGGTLLNTSGSVILKGAAMTIGGSSSTTFPALIIGDNASYTLNTDATATSLTFAVSANNSSLTHANGVSLTVNGNLTVNQPSASKIVAWNVNGGIGHVTGTTAIGGTNASTGRVAKIVVTSGSLALDGVVTYASNTEAITEIITVGSGSLTLGSAQTLTSGTLSVTGSGGNITLAAGATFGGANAPVLSAVAGSTVEFGGSFTTNTTVLTLDAGSTAIFTGTGTVTPNAALSFGSVQLNSGVTLTLAGSIGVAGDWTNNGGTLSAGSNTVTFSGASKTIGGTSTSAFPNCVIAAGASYMMTNSNSCSSLTFNASNTASSLTHASGTSFTVNGGGVTLNHPTASSITTAWNIHAATATVGGLISFPANENTATRVAKLAITTGALHADGGITFSGTGTAAASRVIDMSGGAGTLNLKGALSFSAVATLTAGTSGSIFNYADNAAQTVNFFSAGAYHNLHGNNTHSSGAALSAAITTANVTGNLRVQSGLFDNGGFAIAGNSGKTLEVASGATLRLSGTTSAFPTGFTTVTLGATSTVNYSGTGAQTVVAQNYGHLTVSSARTTNNVTLVTSGTIGVAGTLTATATFSGGNGFVTTSSTVDYNGTGSQDVTALSPLLAGSSSYNNLTLSNTAAAVTAGTSFSVAGTFTVNVNAIFAPSSGVVISGAGTLTGGGTARVTRATGSTDFAGQYTITNRTLTNLTVEFAGAAAQGAGANTFGGLKLNNASGVSLSADVTVNGVLTLTSGNVTTSSNTLIVSATGSVSRTSGHVVGLFKKNVATGATTRTFEVGDASSYTPVIVAFASVTSAGDLTANTASGDHGSIGSSNLYEPKSVNRTWTLSNSGVVFTNYSITLSFVAGDLDGGTSTAALYVGRYASGSWTLPTVGTRTSTSTQATGITAFGDFQVAEYAAPLLVLSNVRAPTGNQPPGTDLTHTVTFTNTGVGPALSIVLIDSLSTNTDFKVGSLTTNYGSSGLTATPSYSNDGGSTWTYVPASGAGGAPAGYDRLVNRIKWTFTGNLSQTGPNNTCEVGFTVRIR